MNALRIIGILAFIGVSVSCSSRTADRTIPRDAFDAYVAAMKAGLYADVFPMLVRDVQAKIAATHQNVRKCAELITEGYPPSLRAQALADLGSEKARNAKTPAEFFAAVVGDAGRPALSTAERMSYKLKRIEDKGNGTFHAATLSGAVLEFVRGGDGVLYLVPQDEDFEFIHAEHLRSIDRLSAAEGAVKAFKSRGR